MNPTHLFWYIVGAVIVGGYGYWYLRKYRQRTAELAAAAKERGWAYTERPPSLVGRCHGLPFSGASVKGRRPRACHEITGDHRDLRFSCFEYSSVLGSSDPDSNDRSERVFLQVFGVRLPSRTPDLTVMPRSSAGQLMHKLGGVSGKTGNPDFDRLWAVHTGDEDFARTTLSPELLSWFVAHKDNQRAFRFRADEVFCWEPGRITIDRIEPAVDYLHRLLSHVPTLRGN